MGLNVAMVTDFFYPQPGGVEFHVYYLSQNLISLGHSVVIITHDYKGRNSVRTLANGLKVYYIPFAIIYRNSTFPTVFLAFPILRNIFIREEIEIVHGHGSLSSLCHEAILHGRTMGLKTVFTDHSLFGFSSIKSILANKIFKFTLTDIGHVICVSHICKENTVLRASLDPLNVSVIPNAVVCKDFYPKKEKNKTDQITIVVISRLFPNKGIELLTAIIPQICIKKPNVKFIIAGDGPNFSDLEQMKEKYFFHDKVFLIGKIKHEDVRDIMVKGDIYLHSSLIEAFGTVLVEAASCGLFVVSTNVGGIPEVLPSHMISYADPEEDSLITATLSAIDAVQSGKINTSGFHDEINKMYSWENVAKRTENVYNFLNKKIVNQSLYERLKRYYQCGPIAGKLFVLCVIMDCFFHVLLDYFFPNDHIDKVIKWQNTKKKKFVT